MQAATRVNAEHASKRVMHGPTCQSMRGRLLLPGGQSKVVLWAAVPGYWRRHVCKRKATATWEVPDRGRGSGQQETGDSQTWRPGMAEGPVVLVKPGHAGGGKGPWFKDDARRSEGQEIG